MERGSDRGAGDHRAPAEKGFPMTGAAQALNRRWGLYLSEGQQRGLAAGLLLGVVVTSAALAYGVAAAVRRGR